MENIRKKVSDLVSKMYFLDRSILKNIEENINSFSEEKLTSIYELLNDVHEKTLNHFDELLKNDPRFFEHAQIFLIHKKESASKVEEESELEEVDAFLNTIE